MLNGFSWYCRWLLIHDGDYNHSHWLIQSASWAFEPLIQLSAVSPLFMSQLAFDCDPYDKVVKEEEGEKVPKSVQKWFEPSGGCLSRDRRTWHNPGSRYMRTNRRGLIIWLPFSLVLMSDSLVGSPGVSTREWAKRILTIRSDVIRQWKEEREASRWFVF